MEKKSVLVTLVLEQKTDREVKYTLPQNTRVTRCINNIFVAYPEGAKMEYPEDSKLKNGSLDFLGWYKNADFTGEPIFIPASGVKAEDGLVLYAKWGKKIPVTGITFENGTKALSVNEGETAVLKPVIAPGNASIKIVAWSSSDTKVAAVDQNGKISALKAGTAVITAATKDGGKAAQCTVTVKAKDPKTAFIDRLYLTCMNRPADESGRSFWLGQINSGNLKGIGLAGKFVFSNEFTSKNYCNEHFVRQLYPALMGREADAGGLKFWCGRLEAGTKREQLVNQFTSSAEYKRLCAAAGIDLGAKIGVSRYGIQPYGPCAVCGEETKVVQFAERMYTVCLDRAADVGGLSHWSKGLCEQTITGKSIVNFFFLCNEIKSKNLPNREYVRRIYKVMLDREPDQGGWNFWTGRLDSGASPTAVIAGFIDSREFTNICNDYGIKRK